MAKKFPDLTGDGKVTQADVLKGRGVFNEGGEVDNYIQLYQQMQMSLGQAETEEDKNKIRQRFEQSVQGFDQSVIMEALKKMDAMRDSKAMGSLMVPPEREGYGKGGALIKVWKALGKEASHQDKELAQEVLDNSPKSKRHSDREYVTRTAFSFGEDYNTDLLLKKDIPEGSQEFRDKFVRAWRSRAKTFSHDGEKYVVEEGKPEIKNERNAKGKGGAILDLVAALTGKQTKSAKKKMVDEEKALQDLSKMVEDNPRVLDELSDEDYEMVVSKLPQSQAAKLGMADEPLDDMVEMARGMAPADVAKNLEMFNSIEDIFEYAEGLDAKDARQFMENLSDEDLEIFGADLPNVGATLGPREVKADGGPMPVDTYDNISPEEEIQQAEDMLPDDEMEEEYIEYVTGEVLEPEEQEYLFKVLDDDPRLEGILDKVILNATEFAGSGEVEGPGTGISDSIPARLSDGEFVITRKATDQIGADNLQKMMDDAERAYDGGLMSYAEGGMPVEGMERYDMEKDDEDTLQRQMAYSNRMPSLMNQ